MAFSDNRFRGAMLVVLNGEDPATAPRTTCGVCGLPLVRMFFTARARELDPSLPRVRDVCITKRWKGPIPCPSAIASAALIDQLMTVARI